MEHSAEKIAEMDYKICQSFQYVFLSFIGYIVAAMTKKGNLLFFEIQKIFASRNAHIGTGKKSC